MSTSRSKNKGYDASEVVVIHVFVGDQLTDSEKSNLYRDLWKWFEDRCIPPRGLTID